MTDQSCDTAASKEKKGPHHSFAMPNDENSPSRAVGPPITELISLQTYLRLTCVTEYRNQCSLSLSTSVAKLHIVTDNKATSVEMRSTLFEEVIHVLTQSGQGQAGCFWLQHLCHMCYQNPQLEWSLLSWKFQHGEEIRASVHPLLLLPPEGPYGWFGSLLSTCLHLFASEIVCYRFVWKTVWRIWVQFAAQVRVSFNMWCDVEFKEIPICGGTFNREDKITI